MEFSKTTQLAAFIWMLSMPALVCGQTPPVFETDVLPILETNCVACHSGDAPKSELDLSDIQSLVNGGLTG